jgi:ubiquinone/menaquinone biosynthesis C-methylase UbiE/uncharacterized protein YbaR (Trm112 family)
MFKKEYLRFLCCPDCWGALALENKCLICKKCRKQYPLIDEIPMLLSSSMKDDVKLSQERWNKEYEKNIDHDKALKLKEGFRNTYLESHMVYFRRLLKSYKNKKYLEIGCGPFFIGQELAKLGAFVVGIDYSINALKLAKFHLENEKITNYLLICGDITKMPFKDNVFDLLYGGGVIEHFKDTVGVVRENYRVLREGGIAFNTVPQLNLGSLTYRQMWGNIPNTPILKQLAELIHVKILKGRRMLYGYEYSFTKGNLRDLFSRAGFKKQNIEVKRFEVPLILEYIKGKFLKKIATVVANSNLFWPIIYIKSKK